MWRPQFFFVASLISWSYGVDFVQHKYEVVPDELIIEYADQAVLDITGGVYKVNETTNAINVSFTLHIDLPRNTKFTIKAFKWINNQYRDSVVQFEKPLKEIFEMEMFDLQSLWVEHARPPIAWPLEKGVTYTTVGWHPDSSKFPPNLPEGRYKVLLLITLPHKRKMVLGYWYARIVYYKH